MIAYTKAQQTTRTNVHTCRFSALPPCMHFNLHSLGLPSVHSIVAMNQAARIRTTKVTAKGWKVQKQKLGQAILENSYINTLKRLVIEVSAAEACQQMIVAVDAY